MKTPPTNSRKKALLIASIVLVVLILSALFFIAYRGMLFPGRYLLDLQTAYQYAVTYKTTSAITYTAGKDGETAAFSGSTDCNFTISFTPIKKEQDSYLIAVEFTDIGSCASSFNGEELFNQERPAKMFLSDRFALMVMSDRGVISKIHFKRNEDVTFKSMVKMILGDIQTILDGKKKEWLTSEKNQNGRLPARYTVVSYGIRATTIEKKKERYDQLLPLPGDLATVRQEFPNGYGITFSNSGYLRSLVGKETLTVFAETGEKRVEASVDLSMALAGTKRNTTEYRFETDGKGGGESFESAELGKVEVTDLMKKRLLESRAKNLTGPEMNKALKQYVDTGELYGKSEYWWRISGYLRLHPEACRDMVPLFNDRNADSKERLFLFGILSSVGNDEAQQVMRELLTGETAKQDKFYSIFLQSFAQLEKPAPQTVQMITDLYEQSKQTGRYSTSTALTVGALAAQLDKSGEGTLAASLNSKLVNDLRTATDGRTREYLLDSLGNATQVANVAVAKEYVADREGRVRASVANSLRNVQTPESEQILLGLAGDQDAVVQRQALSALGRYKLDRTHLEAIRDKVAGGAIRDENMYLEVLSVLESYRGEKEIIRDTLKEMNRRQINSIHVKSRIDQFMKQVE